MKILIKESQLKSFIKNKLGIDLTNRTHLVTNKWELPIEFEDFISPGIFNVYLNKYGPMFFIESKNNLYLTQDRGIDNGWITMDKNGEISDDFEVMTNLGVGKLGLSMNDLISMYF
jgi:hypothetical protein